MRPAFKARSFIACIISVVSVGACASYADQSYELLSPDETIKLEVSQENALTFSLEVDGKSVIPSARIAMEIAGMQTASPPEITASNRHSVNKIEHPVVPTKSSQLADHFNELELELAEFGTVTFRAYDDGIAYRFETETDGQLVVTNEVAEFTFPEESMAHFPREEAFISHNERLYEHHDLAELNTQDLASLPLLIEAGEINLLLTETDLQNYAGMWVTGGPNNSLLATFPKAVSKEHLKRDRDPVIDERHNYIALTDGTRTFPWRVFAVAREDTDLLTNQLSWLMAEPSRIEDSSWIKPGLVAWDWWNANNIFGVDFRAGVNTETYKHYIDFAANNGIPYVVLDEGWYVLGDVLQVNPDMDIPGLMSYAKEKDVELILWVVWETLDQKLEEALAQYEAWGAAGIKVDFMQRDDQWMVDYYWRVAEVAAEHNLLVDFHGAYKPAGLRRTFPNVMTYEGVKGLENNKWSSKPDSDHNTTLPFIRMVAGPMDYTPGAMVNVRPEEHHPIFDRPMSLTTRAHQLALYVIFESPLQMLADSPSNYGREPESTAFISSMPVIWDETVPLFGKIGDYVGIARRSGDNWYVGILTDETEREFTLDLSFLPGAAYDMISFEDGVNADRYASDYRRRVTLHAPAENLSVKLAPNGGWAAILTPSAE